MTNSLDVQARLDCETVSELVRRLESLPPRCKAIVYPDGAVALTPASGARQHWSSVAAFLEETTAVIDKGR